MLPDISVPGGRLHFRPTDDNDLPVLRRVYGSVRTDELAQVPNFPEAAKAAFLDQQFSAQHAYYREIYPAADWLLILFNDQPAGRLYLNRTAEKIHIIDIAFLPEFRGHGLGTSLLRHLFDEAETIGVPVRIFVERFNPALRLYQRLGFEMIDDSNDVYWLMERRPPAVQS